MMLGQRRFGKIQTALLVIIALVMGANLISPAVAHFRPKLGHLIKHVFAKADPRYVNTDELAGGDLSGPHANLQIGANAVGTAEIANNAVATAKIADAAVTTAKLADNSVTSAKIVNGQIRGADLGTITQRSATSGVIAPGAVGNVEADCLAGEQVIGGGNDMSTTANFFVVASRRSGNGWRVFVDNESAANQTVTAHAYCLAA